MFLFKSLITSYTSPYDVGKLTAGSRRLQSYAGLASGGAAVAPRPSSISIDERQLYDVFKRCTDVVGAGTLLLFHIPILALVALAIRLSSSGPVVFRQERLTKDGKRFMMYKFRTMYTDAESHTGAVWARRKDPRVTFVGRFLRVSRLDELPQLLNVLKGDMSLIGPRPERPELAEKLAEEIPHFNRRLEVRAGITGLAQIANGYASSIGSYKRKIAYDLEYVDNCSFSMDMMIALQTIAVVITGFGAK